MKIIIFGGTKEGVELANILSKKGHKITYSIAGKTTKAKLAENSKIHIGGFGSLAKLRIFLAENNFDYIIDATHPYAENISNNLLLASKEILAKFVRFNRPPWQKPNKSKWHEFSDFALAIRHLPKGANVFITTGQKGLNLVNIRPDCFFYIRLIEKPKIILPQNSRLIISRPPFNYENEFYFMKKHNITHLISKNSGSEQTRAKIDVSADLGVDIFILTRPKLKKATEFNSFTKLINFIDSK